MSKFKGQPALVMALLMGIGMLGLIWLISFIPGVGVIRVGSEHFMEVDFIAKEKSASLQSLLAEKRGGLQNMELFGHMAAGTTLTEEQAKRISSSVTSTGNGYLAVIDADGKAVWETGKEGESRFEAEIPLPGGVKTKGTVRLG